MTEEMTLEQFFHYLTAGFHTLGSRPRGEIDPDITVLRLGGRLPAVGTKVRVWQVTCKNMSMVSLFSPSRPLLFNGVNSRQEEGGSEILVKIGDREFAFPIQDANGDPVLSSRAFLRNGIILLYPFDAEGQAEGILVGWENIRDRADFVWRG